MAPQTLLLLLLVALAAPSTDGCRCLIPSLHRTYYDANTINYVKAKIRRVKNPSSINGKRKYVIKILQNYKGCPPLKRRVIIFSFVSSATCGLNLQKKKIYALPIRPGPMPIVSSCDVSYTTQRYDPIPISAMVPS